MAKKPAIRFRTIILSDLHLGTNDCKAEEINFFLKHSRCDKLILNGDVIDGWSLKRKNIWPNSHTKVVRRILKLAQKGVDVIYLRGNHDDFLAHYLPLAFDKLRIVEEHIHVGDERKYLVVHGDCFDAVTTHSKFIAVVGDIGYQQLLRLNRFYNKWRAFWGKEYFSLSKAIKARVKTAVSHISSFENHLQELAAKRGCSGIICGHIHTPEDKMVGKVHYLNSGDWVESMTAIVEHIDGSFEVIQYKDFCAEIEKLALQRAAEQERIREVKLPETEVAPVAAREYGNVLWVHDDEEAAATATA